MIKQLSGPKKASVLIKSPSWLYSLVFLLLPSQNSHPHSFRCRVHSHNLYLLSQPHIRTQPHNPFSPLDNLYYSSKHQPPIPLAAHHTAYSPQHKPQITSLRSTNASLVQQIAARRLGPDMPGQRERLPLSYRPHDVEHCLWVE
jgi:hypothetical protein